MGEARIRTFGDVDRRSLDQLKRCSEEAVAAVLCADHHPGYSQPIGGGVAYENHVSPSGVGFDIACIAAGTLVTTCDGYSLPIEDLCPGHPAACWDGRVVRRIDPSLGAVPKGWRRTVRVRLANGRALSVTPDHRLRTPLGWRAASELQGGDRVACPAFVGLPFEHAAGELPLPEPRGPASARCSSPRAQLEALDLWPLRVEDSRFPRLLRLLGYLAGDGHLSRKAGGVSFYTSIAEDAEALAKDLEQLGFVPRTYTRQRPNTTEHLVKVGSVALHALFEAMGCPTGAKVRAWPAEPCPWLFDLPAWLRAQFLSGFAGAEATTPLTFGNRLRTIAIKQAGDTPNAINFTARLCRSLGFAVGVSASGARRRDLQTWVAQLLGGEPGQLRFLEEVGYSFAAGKRRAAAAGASIAWQRLATRERCELAVAEARAHRHVGAWSTEDVKRVLSKRHGVPASFVEHAMYSDRGAPRAPKGSLFPPDHSNEVAWIAVESVQTDGPVPVFDLVTDDPAESFIAAGIVIHNCGNKAARTPLRASEVDVPQVMNEVVRRISFGLGRANQEKVDHPVLDRIAKAEFQPQRKLLDTARRQLGTVGSGNHYVDLFEDEEGLLWVGVHFGSRGFGHRTATGFLALAQGAGFEDRVKEGGMDAAPVLLRTDTELGEHYIEAMQLAGEYAYAGRNWVVDRVLSILGTHAVEEVHNHHNFAWLEKVEGRDAWVVRKGCTPAFPGQKGFVGGSMGDISVILEGIEGDESREALHSTVHGAGRVMSRSQAAGKVRRRKVWACSVRDCDFTVPAKAFKGQACPDHPRAKLRQIRTQEIVRPGRIDWPRAVGELRQKGIEIRGGGADEAPGVYKRLPDVLDAHAGSIKVLHELKPLGVAMAGPDIVDPFRD